jgi:hypothetical protein
MTTPRRPAKWKPTDRDTRRPATPEEVVDALSTAATALEPWAKSRLWVQSPESFAKMRAIFSTLPDDERRRILLFVAQDEGRRIADERSLGRWPAEPRTAPLSRLVALPQAAE